MTAAAAGALWAAGRARRRRGRGRRGRGQGRPAERSLGVGVGKGACWVPDAAALVDVVAEQMMVKGAALHVPPNVPRSPQPRVRDPTSSQRRRLCAPVARAQRGLYAGVDHLTKPQTVPMYLSPDHAHGALCQTRRARILTHSKSSGHLSPLRMLRRGVRSANPGTVRPWEIKRKMKSRRLTRPPFEFADHWHTTSDWTAPP
jgi:hypothetical protein